MNKLFLYGTEYTFNKLMTRKDKEKYLNILWHYLWKLPSETTHNLIHWQYMLSRKSFLPYSLLTLIALKESREEMVNLTHCFPKKARGELKWMHRVPGSHDYNIMGLEGGSGCSALEVALDLKGLCSGEACKWTWMFLVKGIDSSCIGFSNFGVNRTSI